MFSASSFGPAVNTYLDLDYSVYHKNLIQWLFIVWTPILYVILHFKEIARKSLFLCVNRIEARLSGMVFVPAQDVSGVVWTKPL